MDISGTLVLTLIAATIPFVVCIFAAFNPASQVRDVGDYYLYDRELDVDSFLKSTIGYSLQVAAIALFITWTFSYGIWCLVVCAAWGAGYWIVARLVQKKRFEAFLGTGRKARENKPNEIATIHGYIQSRLGPCPDLIKRLTILIVSLASVIGLGGTMLTEIYYGTSFFTSAIGIAAPDFLLETIIHLFILFFGLLYVLWGGYRASVFIDRFQTPIAYVAFGIFALGLATFTKNAATSTSAVWIVGSLLVIYVGLLFGRLRLLKKTMPTALWNKAISYLTFLPLIFLSLGCILFLWSFHLPKDLWKIMFPHVDSTIGFGIAGAISLSVANAIWQLIDISSLQRLQSLDIKEVKEHRSNIVSAFQWIGIETAAGWAIIVAASLLLAVGGFSIADDQVSTVVLHFFQGPGTFSLLLPVFIFAVVVFMVSTVSCFIAALSYIARYDIAPTLKLLPPGGQSLGENDIAIARLTTLVVVVVLYACYSVFSAALGHTSIAVILYAVYAFQLAITPTVLISLFMLDRPVSAWAAIGSTIFGMGVALWTAMQPLPPSWLAFIGNDSWYVIPPIAVILVSCVAYLFIYGLMEAAKTSSHN